MTSGYLVVLVVAATATAVTAPICRAVAVRAGIVTTPNDRSPDSRSLPLMGGVAMYVGLLAGAATAWRLDEFEPVISSSTELLAVLLGAGVTLVVGVVDDARSLSPPAKLAGQVLGCAPLFLLGVTIVYLQLPGLGLWSVGADFSPLLTVLWVIAVATAINFIDGLDGLAAGVVGISSLAIALFAFRLQDLALLPGGGTSTSPLIAVLTVGICAGFLVSNFHPATMIMGDGGALMLGVLVASSSLLIGSQTIELPRSTVYFALSPLLVPAVILGVPVIDTAFAIVRRSRQGLSPAGADKRHLHHRLIELGHGHRRAVLILWLWTVILSALGLIPAYTDQSEALAPVALACATALFLTVLRPIHVQRRHRASDRGVETLAESPPSSP